MERGNGDAIPAAKLARLDEDDVRSRYIQKTFVPSLTLKEIEAVLK